MDLSIVIPVYNGQDCVRRSLDSILALQMPARRLEVIVVDDCSTDQTRAVLEDYADRYEQIDFISLPVNKKPGGARNAGIERAKGEYILLLDADDTVSPGLLDALSYALEKGVEMLLCPHDYQPVFQGAFTGIQIDMPVHHPFEGKVFMDWYYVPNTMGSCYCYLFKNSYLKGLGHPLEEGVYYEDVDWVEFVAYHCPRIEYDPSVILSYYFTPGSIVNSTNVTKEADIVLFCCRRMAFAYSVRNEAPRFYENSLSHQGWIASIIKFRHLTTFDRRSLRFFYDRIEGRQGFSWLRQLEWKGFTKLFVFHPKWAMALIDLCHPLLRAGRGLVHSIRNK